MLSVVIVTYNQEKCVLHTLNSMLKSDVHDMELIVTDDFSTDRTPEVVEDWIDKNGHQFANAKLVKGSKNVGIVGNFRKGIAASKGSLLKGLAGDDWFLPGAIDIIKKYDGIKNTIFCSDVVEVDELTGKKRIRRNDRRLFTPMTNRERANLLAGVGCMILAPGAFYSRDVWDDSAHLLCGIKHIEDYYLWFCSAKKGKRFAEVAFSPVCYRVHGNNTCAFKLKKLSAVQRDFLRDEMNINIKMSRDAEVSLVARYSAMVRFIAGFLFYKSYDYVGRSVAMWLLRIIRLADPIYFKNATLKVREHILNR
nr:glycosyltransferase family 2 protein [uncultured Dethiosulfovibrio sp.]